MPEVKIGVVRERTGITEEGKFYTYAEVEYFIDDARHILTIPSDKYSAKAAEEAVRKAAKEFIDVQGKKVTM